MEQPWRIFIIYKRIERGGEREKRTATISTFNNNQKTKRKE